MGLTGEAALAVAGVALAGPPLVDLILVVAKQIYTAAQHHIHLKDHVETCQRLLMFCKGETTDLLTWFAEVWENLPLQLQDQIHSISDTLLGLYVNVARSFPAASISGHSSTSGNNPLHSQKATAKLSWHSVERIEKSITTIEQWNGRLHLRAVEILFFTRWPTPNTRAGVLRNIKVIDRVDKIRDAVYNNLQHSDRPCSQVLLPDEQGLDVSQPLKGNAAHSLLRKLDVPSVGIVFVETQHHSDDAKAADIDRLRKTLRDVASIFRHADPEMMGILTCRGFKYVQAENKFELHFLSPKGLAGAEAQSLRSLLRTSSKLPVRHDLRSRLDVVRNLAAAVYYIHAGDFVHKNIRPDNIIVMDIVPPASTPDAQKKQYCFPRALGKAFLVGYDGLRKTDAASQRLAVDDPSKAIYLSPQRAKLRVDVNFTMEHDVYSLGVVLLELGLWTDFSRPGKGYAQELWSDSAQTSSLQHPDRRHKALLDLTQKDLPSVMGSIYAETVAACLNGLVEETHAGATKDSDGVQIGTAYISQVVKRLEDMQL